MIIRAEYNTESASLGRFRTLLPDKSEDTKLLRIERNVDLKRSLEERGQRGWGSGDTLLQIW